mgnify:CR=1 FL=1
MANELDKTIEELEAEVLDELEEANGNAPKPNATATDPMDKLDSDGATGATETIPGSTPDKVAPHKGADASKGAKTDTSIPKKGKADKMDTAKDFQYLEIVIRHCQSAYKISCTNAAFEKAKQLNYIDQKGCFRSLLKCARY